MTELDEWVRIHLAAGDAGAAATLVLRELGPELLGFLDGAVGETDADDVYSDLSVRLWLSLGGFEGRCSVRTWAYVLARHELGRFRKGAKRHEGRLVPISGLESLLAAARTRTRSTMVSDRERKLAALRSALPVDDRSLLMLRIDRELAWYEIALVFVDNPETVSEADRKREAARLRKRFQILKERLVVQARAVAL